MERIEALKALLAKVEAGSLPRTQINSEIDAELRVGTSKMRKDAPWAWSGFPNWGARKSAKFGWRCELLHSGGRGGVHWKSEDFCGSIDAAMAARDAALDGWECGFDGSIAWVKKPGLRTSYRHNGQNCTTALAIICAILKALIAETTP